MTAMNINLFSMKLKRVVDIFVILPDDIENKEKLRCLWFCDIKNINSLDLRCDKFLEDYVNDKHFAVILPQIYEACFFNTCDNGVKKELITILNNMLACISDNEKDHFYFCE